MVGGNCVLFVVGGNCVLFVVGGNCMLFVVGAFVRLPHDIICSIACIRENTT